MNVYKEAYNKGYRVIDGVLYDPNKKIINGSITPEGYISTKITKHGDALFVHRFVAYQKYGDIVFKEGMQVRHFDGNSLNNLDDNIKIGNQSQNMMDIPKEVRLKKAIHASSYLRNWTDEEEDNIRQFHNETKSYKKTMEKFGISSKGSLHHILKKNTPK